MFDSDWLDYIETSVEWIDPELARQYLGLNFSRNRPLLATTSNEYAVKMKDAEWLLSTDAIGFDIEGHMINGQHRLNAVIASGTTQPFLVVRGLPVANATVLDMGKRRMMHERLTVAGHEITSDACAIIRNAMTDYTSSVLGTNKYSKQHTDEIVWDNYSKHRTAVDSLVPYAKGNKKASTVVIAAAVKMYVHLSNPNRAYRGRRFRSEAERAPMNLAREFLEIAATGTSNVNIKPEDRAASLLHNAIIAHRAKGMHWANVQCYRISVSAAYNFALGQENQSIRTYHSDPFDDIKAIASTNDVCVPQS